MNWVLIQWEAVLNNIGYRELLNHPPSNATRQASLCTSKQSRRVLPVTPVYIYHILSRKNKYVIYCKY